jgi:hypothetical protein
MGAGKTAVKGSTQHSLAQFSYEEIGGPMPWERQPNESAIAYRYFQYYRDMDPTERGYGKIKEKFGVGQTVVIRNGSVQRWVERAAAWDFHLERARLIQAEKYQMEMAVRHAEIAQEMLARVKQWLLEVDLKKLGPKEVAQWLEVGVQVERLSRGMNSEQAVPILNQTNIQIKQMSDKEIALELAREGVRGQSSGKAQKFLQAVTDGEAH